MRLLTYNIHGWKGAGDVMDVERLARIIEASQADIVGLNEVFHPLTPPGLTRPVLDLLAEKLGMSYAFGVALTPRFAFAPLAAYGNALLSRYPILAHAGHHLNPIPGHEQRGLLECRVLLPAGRATLSVYVTHLDHKSEQARNKQVSALLQWTVRDRSRPHLLLGDFNALAPADYEVRPDALADLAAHPRLGSRTATPLLVLPRLLKAGYVDLLAAAGRSAPTFPASDPQVRIDYILASAALAPAARRCFRFETGETAGASDHLPLLAEFDLSALSRVE